MLKSRAGLTLMEVMVGIIALCLLVLTVVAVINLRRAPSSHLAPKEAPEKRTPAASTEHPSELRGTATTALRAEEASGWPFDAAEAKRRQSDAARALAVDVERDVHIAPGVKMRLVLIPGGEFMMGSGVSAAAVSRLAGQGASKAKHFEDEHPQHRVTIARPFWMGKYEVTQEQWQAVMGSNPSRFKGATTNPVERVSWDDFQGFLQKLNARMQDMQFALPTEAQWEYACRAGTATPFHFGETISTTRANYDGDHIYGTGRKGEDRKRSMPVGSFPPNAWGLHDLHGNVWEWCASPYAGRYDGSEKRGAEAAGRLRVVRGGGWASGPTYCRAAVRFRCDQSDTFHDVGFRVVVPVAARTAPVANQ